MAYNALNNLIDAYIYANGVQAITGQILNGVLKQMVSQLGSGYHLMGVATPQTVPATDDYAMAYFAATAGEYTDFGGITLAAGEVAVLLTSGNGSWSKQTIYNVPTGTADLENTAGFITNTVADLVNYYTKTEIDTTLADYPTLEALATALADYYTKTEIDTQKAETDAALADRYTKSETDTKLADYYRKAETYDKDEVDSIVAALSRQSYVVSWNGTTAPDVSTIPAGVTVTYSGTTYTGTMAASASTMNKIYMVWNGTAYDMYGTSQDGGYSWVPMGTTTVDLSQYATKAEVSQLEAEVDGAEVAEIQFTQITGAYISTDGQLVSYSGYSYSAPFRLEKGDFVSITAGGSGVAILSKVISPGVSYGPKVLSSAPHNPDYQYTVEEGGDYAVSYMTSSGCTIIVKRNTPGQLASAIGVMQEAVAKNTIALDKIVPEIGTDENTTISYNADDGYETWNWDGTKYVNNANWMLFLIPLVEGRTYDLTGATVSGYNNRRFFAAKPVVNVAITPTPDPGNVFTAGGTSGIKWLGVNIMKAQYESGTAKTYTFICYPYGMESDVKDLKEKVSEHDTEIAAISLKTPMIQAYPYFAGGIVPSITRNRNTYTVTIPTNTFVLRGADGSAVLRKSINEELTFTIPLAHRLVYNRTSGNYEVVADTDTGDFVVLAFNNGGLLDGAFSIYGVTDALESNSVRRLYYRDKRINESIIQAKYRGGVNLLLFSDIHGDGERLDRIMEFNSLFYGSWADILHCGDTVEREFSDGVAFWENVANTGRVLNVVGNHDTAAIINDNYDWKAVGNLDVYNRFFANVAQWGVTQPSGAAQNGLSYYYKDYGSAPNKVRMIVLNCMVMGPDASNYDPDQITWFQSVLSDAKNNSLPVLVVSHCAPKSAPIDCQFTSNYFDAYGQFGGGYGGDGVFVSAVEQFINDGGEFISWLCGDTHKDYLGNIVGHPEQPVIIVGSALCISTTSLTMTRVAGTPTEDLFNVLSIHPERKTIKIKRIGSAIDIDFKSHDLLSFNYETRTVITSM